MIQTMIYSTGGIFELEGPSLTPKAINDFIQLIKEHGVWIDGSPYKFEEVIYNADNKCFDITVK